jgi:dihydroorotate dehydrogenase (fumarate)/dihydroorotate dehydrogenase
VHHYTIEACRLAAAIPLVRAMARALLEFTAPELACEVAGLRFANPIGLAAGWDKNGRALAMLGHLGFGFAEIGSISAQPSKGNPRPRLFRLPIDRAIVVNYGLPNDGVDVIARRLARHHQRVPIGVNIVKTNHGPDAPANSDEAILADYGRSVSLAHRHAGYLALNLSCPNAKGGKDFFAEGGNIRRLLTLLGPMELTCPVFLKVAPNPRPEAMQRLLEECQGFGFVKGFIFNLPPGKPLPLTTPRRVWEKWPGAVSGKPVEGLINACIAELYRQMPRGRYAIIGAGGVFTAEDAYRKIRLGASLVQVYTAMIYEGPGVVRRINEGLCKLLQRDGFKNVAEAVGADVVSSRG